MKLPSYSSKQPLFPEIGIVALVPDRWESLIQTRHQILSRLSQYFNVVWCEPPFTWGNLPVRKLIRNNKINFQLNSRLPSEISVYTPGIWLPFIGRSQFLATHRLRQRLRQIRKDLISQGCKKIILYLWRPYFASSLDLIDHDFSCYHIDDEYSFSELELPVSKEESDLINRVDQVFASSPALVEKKGKFNAQTVFIPNGVDYEAFITPRQEPMDLMSIPHPRMGYVGVMKKQLNFALLETVARNRPQWSFVFVGPQQNHKEVGPWKNKLSQLPNVYFLGGKSVRDLPAYTQHMDVCMLCYTINGYTKFIYPLKLHEYLAAGPPIVGAPIPSLQSFSSNIKIARSPQEWDEALQASLDLNARSSEKRTIRQDVARQHDWNRLVREMVYILCSKLDPSFLKSFEGNVDFIHFHSTTYPFTK